MWSLFDRYVVNILFLYYNAVDIWFLIILIKISQVMHDDLNFFLLIELGFGWILNQAIKG